jgi:hypothetical protein
MNTSKIIALLAALLLTTAEFVVLDRDAQHHVARYQSETAGALALAASPAAIRLTRLNLALNCIQADGFRAIVASPYLANLVVLNVFERSLYDLSIDAAVVEVLKARFGQGMSFEVEG